MFIIIGVFFQQQQWLSTAMSPREGMVAVIRSGLIYDTFLGVIVADPEKPSGSFVGGMQDHFGESTLSDITISDSAISFIKKYDKRSDFINYTFTVRDGEEWYGEYDGPAVGSGISRCKLVQVPDDFLLPQKCLKLLGRKVAHTWDPR